jgi:hypothetical protein
MIGECKKNLLTNQCNHGGGEGYGGTAKHIHETALDGGRWSTPRFGRLVHDKEQVYIVQEAGWAWGPVWTTRKDSPQPGFDRRTVQTMTSCYID